MGDEKKKKIFLRISGKTPFALMYDEVKINQVFSLSISHAVLVWADVLVAYALFVLTHASLILSICNGVYRILPLFFLYLVDRYLSHLKLLVFIADGANMDDLHSLWRCGRHWRHLLRRTSSQAQSQCWET